MRSHAQSSIPRSAEPSVAISIPSGPGASALTALSPVVNVARGFAADGSGKMRTSRPPSATANSPPGSEASAEIGFSKARSSVAAPPPSCSSLGPSAR
jgi:hypothetical protein